MYIQQKQIPSKEQEIVLKNLAESVARPGCKFLEVGSWCGDSTIILGKIAQKNGGHLFCVDWWKGNIGTDLARIAKKKDIFSLFWKNIRCAGLADTVIPIRGQSDIAATVLKEQTFDLVFLDGDHRFEAMLNDIKEYAPLLRKEKGIFCGHDCDGYISDFDRDLLEKGKNRDIYKRIHCGVVLAVGTAFKNYSIDYNIWSVRTSNGELNWQPTNLQFPVPKLLETYNRFNLIRYRNRIYAMHSTLGSVDLVRDEKILNKYQESGKCIVGKSIEEVKQLVEQMWCADPELIEEGYKQFNIIRYKDKYYAVAQSLGCIDFALTLTKEEELQTYEEHGKCFIAHSLTEAKLLIDQMTTFFVPKLIEERYRGFNIVHYKNKYYAVSQDLGPIDFLNIKESEIMDYQKQKKFFIGDSLYEAKYLLEQRDYQQLQRELLEIKKNIKVLSVENLRCTSDINKLTLNIEEQNNQIGKLQETVTERDKSIQQLHLNIEEAHKDIASRDKRIESFEQEIAHRDNTISKLNADIAEQNKHIDALQKDILNYNEKKAALEKEILHKEENISKLNANIMGRNKHIETLEKDLSDRGDTINKLIADIEERNQKLNELQGELEEKKCRVERLTGEVSDRDTRIEDFQRSVSEKEAEIHSLKSEILDRDSKIEGLRKDVLEKAENIRKLNADIQGHNRKIEALQASISDKDKAIETFKADVAHRGEAIAKLNTDIQEYSKKIEALKAELSYIKSKWWFRLFMRNPEHSK